MLKTVFLENVQCVQWQCKHVYKCCSVLSFLNSLFWFQCFSAKEKSGSRIIHFSFTLSGWHKYNFTTTTTTKSVCVCVCSENFVSHHLFEFLEFKFKFRLLCMCLCMRHLCNNGVKIHVFETKSSLVESLQIIHCPKSS